MLFLRSFYLLVLRSLWIQCMYLIPFIFNFIATFLAFHERSNYKCHTLRYQSHVFFLFQFDFNLFHISSPLLIDIHMLFSVIIKYFRSHLTNRCKSCLKLLIIFCHIVNTHCAQRTLHNAISMYHYILFHVSFSYRIITRFL